jgi:phosphotransferase system  glucose/maltose/N-acetylglucosamine-specific IIC component
MDSHIFIALVGGLVNMALSVTVPCLVKKTNQPFLNDVKKVFDTNRQVIITSSLIVALTIYLALKIAPDFYNSFNQLTGLETDSSSVNLTHRPIIVDAQINPQLRNLIKLMNRD